MKQKTVPNSKPFPPQPSIEVVMKKLGYTAEGNDLFCYSS